MTTRISLPLPLTLTPSLRSHLNSALLASSSIHRIHASLLTAAQSSGWLDNIRARALELLREAENDDGGRAVTYREVLETVVREARGRGEGEANGNGIGCPNGVKKRRSGNDADYEDYDGGEVDDTELVAMRSKKRRLDVGVPDSVVGEGVKVVREVLEGLVDVLEGEGEGR